MAVYTASSRPVLARSAWQGKGHIQAPVKRQVPITEFQSGGKCQKMNGIWSSASSPDTDTNYGDSQDLFQTEMNSDSCTSTREMVQSSPEDLSEPVPAESNHISRGRKESTRQDSVSSVTSDHLSDGNSNDDKKKQKNREYAKQSRYRKAQKMKNQEEEIANLKAEIQINQRLIGILFKQHYQRLPNFRKQTLEWHPDRKPDNTLSVECLLPDIDANLMQRLGNSSIGWINDSRQIEKVKVESPFMQDYSQEDKMHGQFENYSYGTNGYPANNTNNMSEENLEFVQTPASSLTNQSASFTSQPSNDMLNCQLPLAAPNVSKQTTLRPASSNTGNGTLVNHQTHMQDYFHPTKGSSARPGNEKTGQYNQETNNIAYVTPVGLSNSQNSIQAHNSNSDLQDDLDYIKPSIGKVSSQ